MARVTVPDIALLIIRVIPLLMVGLAVLAAVLIMRSRRARLPVLPPVAPGSLGAHATLPGAPPSGVWNAKVDAGGGFRPFSGFGRIEVANGWLAFTPDGSAEPAWRVPVAGIEAGKNIALLSAEVWLTERSLGRLNLTVSREHINRMSDNDFKDMRERRYADEFLYALHGSGAVIDPGT